MSLLLSLPSHTVAVWLAALCMVILTSWWAHRRANYSAMLCLFSGLLLITLLIHKDMRLLTSTGSLFISNRSEPSERVRPVLEEESLEEESLEGKSLPKQLPAPAAHAPSEIDEQIATLQQLFMTEARSDNAQKRLDSLKRRYEQAIVVFALLAQCEQATSTDFYTLMQGLRIELEYIQRKHPDTAINIPQFIRAVIDSANGTAEARYSNYDCSSHETPRISREFNALITRIEQKLMLSNP